MPFVDWLENLPFSIWILESDWAHPVLLVFHAVGMAMVVGMIWMISARILGFAGSLPLASFERAFRIAWLGFAINAGSGAVLFAVNGDNYLMNPAFDAKMALIAAGGLTIWLLHRATLARPEVVASGVAPARAKVLASAAILFWLGAIVAGRVIAYTLEVIDAYPVSGS